MSALWSGWGADAFTEQVEKATSELLPVGSEDIALNLDICDQVRAKQVQPKQAMQVIKRRISHKNPNVILLALGLTDICIKNGGDHFLQEVASREFMDNLVSVLKNPSGVNLDVKNKALGLIQNWAQIAEAKPSHMSYIIDVYKMLKNDDRFDFPPPDPNAVTSAALVETLTAPEWVDGEVCMRCRTPFTTFNRKHHCRNCGNVFCQQCSSHNMALPWYGIGQDVRVCDGCFARKGPPKNAAKLSRSKSASSPSSSSKYIPSGRGGSASHQRSSTLGGKTKRSARAKEEEDLALAIKLSLEASGQGAGVSSRPEAFSAPSQPPSSNSAQRQSNGRKLEGTDAEDDPELAAAIAASLRDWAPPQPSAPDGLNDVSAGAPRPSASASHGTAPAGSRADLPLPPSLDLAPQDVDNILTFSQTIQAQQAHNQRNGIVGAPPHQQAQALYEKASTARPRMARNLEEGYRRHNVLVSMHDKLTEAVKLYDRLLDAQMSRPAQQYANTGYGAAPNAYTYGYTDASASRAPSYGAPQHHAPASSLYPQIKPHQMPPQAAPQHAAPSMMPTGSSFAGQQASSNAPVQAGSYQQAAYATGPQNGHADAAGPSQPSNHTHSNYHSAPSHPSSAAYAVPTYQEDPGHSAPYAAGAHNAPVASPLPQGLPAHAPPYGYRQSSAEYPARGYAEVAAGYAEPSPSIQRGGPYFAPAMQQDPAAPGYASGPMPTIETGMNGNSVASPYPTPSASQENAYAQHAGQHPQQEQASGVGQNGASGEAATSQNGWDSVPIQSVAPQQENYPSNNAYLQQTAQPGQMTGAGASAEVPKDVSQAASHPSPEAARQQASKADLSRLPLFPIAPHPENGLRAGPAEAISPAASTNTNAPSSAGMWQTSPAKSPNPNNAVTESPLIQF